MKPRYQTNTFYYLANKALVEATEEKETQKNNLTQTFWQEIQAHIDNHEIIILNINAKPRLGKSTAAIAIGQEIFKMLKKAQIRQKHERFGLKNIARDDQEYSELMRNPKTNNTVIVIDESNELEKGGTNATVEAQLKKVFSDVQAARYVHTVWCSPKEVANPNADIILEVYAKNKGKTLCKLYYKLLHANQEYIMLLGYIEIDVSKLIKKWEDIKRIYYKENRTPKEQQKIDQTAKKDFYTQYTINKHYKIDLISEEFILRPRELPYATPKLQVINIYKHMAGKIKITEATIQAELKVACRKHKIAYTIVGRHEFTQDIMSVLQAYETKYRCEQKIKELKNLVKTDKITLDEYDNKIKVHVDLLERAESNIVELENELEHYQKVYQKYTGHSQEKNKED